MRSILLALALIAAIAAAQSSESLSNETIIKLVASGVPPATVIRTIETADSVSFRFLPADLMQLAQYMVPESVIKAMAARSNRVTQPAAAPAKAAPAVAASPIAAPVPAAAPAPVPPQPRRRFDQPSDFQGRGMWDVDFQASVSIPHASAAAYSGFASGNVGYFVGSKSEVGFGVSGIFLQPLKDIVLGGFYRQYFASGGKRLVPFVGAGAGANIIHVSELGTNGNFAALGGGGLRIFAARHVAVELGYQLVWVRVDGLGFKDTSSSQLAIGFAHVFGK